MIAKDKQLHFAVGAAVSVIAVYVSGAAWLGVGVAAVLGAGKEVYDHLHRDRHTPDIYDFLATVAGGAAGALLMWGLQ